MIRARAVLFAATASLLFVAAAPAGAQETFAVQNVRSASLDGKTIVSAARIDVVGANLTRAEVERLASLSASEAERADLLLKLKAARISIPELVIERLDDGKSRVVVRGYLAENVDSGRFERITLDGFEGAFSGEGAGEGRLKSGPVALEGGDFSKVIAAAKAGAAADGSGKLRLFSWRGFEASVPDTKLPSTAAGGNLYRFSIASVRATTDYAGDLPTKAAASFEGLAFAAPPGSEAGRSLAGFGYDKIELGIGFDGSYDPAARAFQLRDYSLRGQNAGALAVSGNLGGLDADVFVGDSDQRAAALLNSNVQDLTIRYEDSGLAEKALAFYAAMQGKNASSVRRELMMMTGVLPILMGGSPGSLRVAQAVGSFLNEPKSLTVSLKGKAGPLSWVDLAKLTDPAAFFSRVEITAVANR